MKYTAVAICSDTTMSTMYLVSGEWPVSFVISAPCPALLIPTSFSQTGALPQLPRALSILSSTRKMTYIQASHAALFEERKNLRML